jgi:hypothetical protein
MLKVKAMTSVAGKGPTENILSSAVHMQSIHHQASRSWWSSQEKHREQSLVSALRIVLYFILLCFSL